MMERDRKNKVVGSGLKQVEDPMVTIDSMEWNSAQRLQWYMIMKPGDQHTILWSV